MKSIALAVIFAMFAAVPSSAQQTSNQRHPTQSRHVVEPSRKARLANVPACDSLTRLGLIMDRLYGNPVDEVLAAMDGVGQKPALPAVDIDADPVWDELMDCANQTQSAFQRTEALRVAAMWENWRAETFRRQYLTAAAFPIKSPQCQDLNRLARRVDAAKGSAERFPTEDFGSVTRSLLACAEDSERLNNKREQPEALRARRLMFDWVGTAYNHVVAAYSSADADKETQSQEAEILAKVNREARSRAAESEWRSALANPSSLVSISADRNLTGEQLEQVAEHNRSLCDQIITVTRMTPNGLALEPGSPDGRKFLAQKYPRTCLLEDSTRVAPGVPRYLLVYANSDSAFAGFQPVQQTTSSPVLGSGTITSPYGNMWNFTFSGTMQTTETVQAPYVVESQSLFVYAYDASGNIVSRHSITTSRQSGGDPSYAAGYNTGALLSQLWNNPKRLAESVLKDVQKASGH